MKLKLGLGIKKFLVKTGNTVINWGNDLAGRDKKYYRDDWAGRGISQQKLKGAAAAKAAEVGMWMANAGQYQDQLSQFMASKGAFGGGAFGKITEGSMKAAAAAALKNVDQTNPYSYRAQLGGAATEDERRKRRASSIMSSSPDSLASVTGSASGKTLLGQ
jgi:hypothetical protein